MLAFAAFRRLHDPHARLTLVGGQSAGEYWRALHRLAADLGIADAVTFTDVVSHAELLACYRTADVLLCLSEHEGFNVPVLEAMHFDVPVVAYAAGAVPDTVGDGGLLLTDKDPLVVATAVERLRSDPSLRTRLVDAGRRRVEHFSIAHTGPQLIETLIDPDEGIPMTGQPVTGRLAFVPPRYGTEIVGGSEAVMREAAHGLADRGWDVEMLTTCARDHYTWRNEYSPR